MTHEAIDNDVLLIEQIRKAEEAERKKQENDNEKTEN